MSELLLGFDVREMCFASDDMWPPDRRTRYLLKPSTDKSLSVDTLVWPSVFDTGQGAGWYSSDRARAGLSEPRLPPWIGRNMDLWEDLAQMLAWFEVQPGTASCESMTVAITLADVDFVPSDAPPYALGPFYSNGQWEALGYDVADGSLLSGLSNCGYSKEEVDTLIPLWGSLLNLHHLFKRSEDAGEFRRYTDQRVPEHSPFHVFGLWRSKDQ